jgi:hypothetical protein
MNWKLDMAIDVAYTNPKLSSGAPFRKYIRARVSLHVVYVVYVLYVVYVTLMILGSEGLFTDL